MEVQRVREEKNVVAKLQEVRVHSQMPGVFGAKGK
jgi:hypothetical protein